MGVALLREEACTVSVSYGYTFVLKSLECCGLCSFYQRASADRHSNAINTIHGVLFLVYIHMS